MIGQVQTAFELLPATTRDADELAETVRQCFESFREWAPAGWDPPPPQMEAARIREGLTRPATWGMLALDGTHIAGHVALAQAREREPPRPDIPGLAHLWMLFVRRPWWGSGLAGQLNRLAVEEAGRRGYEAMRLHTPLAHARARRFYEREGWVTDGVAIPEPLLGIDLVTYRRALP